MKKLLIVVALLAALPLFAERVDPETAHKVATTFLTNNGAKASQLTDLTRAAGFPNLYIFTAEEGFVVMSADDCVKPILGYSLTDKFVAENMPENISSWLQNYNDEIQYAIKHGVKADTGTKLIWNDLFWGKPSASRATFVVDNLVKTTWGQGSPYNDLCPYDSDDNERTVTGCVATAMAQIMRYWEYPSQGLGSHSYTPSGHPKHGTQYANFGATTYEWNNMTNTYESSSTDAEKLAVATLMYHCGVSLDMDYDYSKKDTPHNGSSAYTPDVMFALEFYFNYAPSMQYKDKSKYNDEVWIALLKQELDNNRPIQYRGNNDTGGGHSFICDGFDSDNRFHFNWGWSGNNNGYYLIGSMCPQAHYVTNQAAIFGIQPPSYNEHPTNLTAVPSGRNVNLTWDGFGDANLYYVYRDYNLIDSTTSCTFSDANVTIGTHIYLVRGIKNDIASKLSNIATAEVTFGGTMEELKIDHLQASFNNGDVSLEWSTPYRLNYIDYHFLEDDWNSLGTGYEDLLYWGVRFPASMLTEGTTLNSVSYLFNTEGTYSTYIFQCTGGIPSGDTLLKVTRDYPKGWNNIVFSSSLAIDSEKDLWVIFKSTSIPYPITFAEYNADDGNYYSENGSEWFHFTGYSFLISANLSDGSYTYNIYDGNNLTPIANSLTTPCHTLSNISSDAVHQYFVKAQKGENVSAASNTIGFTRGTASIASIGLGDKDKMTVTEGSSLTVGTLSNTNPENLIIENGAQLIHSSNNVKATVKKHIEPYTADDNGWYFIANPTTSAITPSESNGFLNGTSTENTFDLYYYDEPSHQWKNYENQAFELNPEQGYLYANGETGGTTLVFQGELNPSNSSITISDLSHSASTLNGFNLVGNPFACNATVNKDCYVIDGKTVILATSTKEIAPCEGVMVKAADSDESVTFTKVASSKEADLTNSFDLEITQDKALIDRARVRFGEGNGMEKFSLDGRQSQISLQQDGQDYAVLYHNGQNTIPVNFKAAQNGTYTLTVSAPLISHLSSLNYLHLIDHRTGDDIDLLVTPSYTFVAQTSQYPERFQLVFADPANSDNADENIEGDLQIFDMTGRIVATDRNTRLTPGVYILRTINGNDIKTEKIIIK